MRKIFFIILSTFVIWIPSLRVFSQVEALGQTLGGIAATELREKNILPMQVVVIDPGHGGQDTGISDSVLSEKDMALILSLELKKRLNQQPRINVGLTRERDMFMSLLERVTVANKKEADIFVSLHQTARLNAEDEAVVRIYYNQKVSDERLENQLEKNQNVGGKVLPWDLGQNDQLVQSRLLGFSVYESIRGDKYTMKHSIKVEEPISVPLAVLRGIHAPGIVVEVPIVMIDVDGKEKKQADEAWLGQIADDLKDGILRFMEKR